MCYHRADQLEPTPTARSSSARRFRDFDRFGTTVDVEAGRILVAEGTVGREAFVVVDGTAVVTRGDEFVAELGPGDVFGELAVLGSGARNATVAATSPMTLLVLTRRELHGLLDAKPSFAQSLLHTIAERLGPAAAPASLRALWSPSTGAWRLTGQGRQIAPSPPASSDRFEEHR